MVVPALLLAAQVLTWTVDAGTLGALVEDHRAPLVTVTVEFPVGTWSPWARAHDAGDAFAFQDDDPGRSLRKRADALAATIDLGMGRRSATMSLRCLKDDLDATLLLAKEVLANTRYDEHELKRAQRERKLRWRGLETDVGFRTNQAAARLIFAPDDPRRLPFEKPEPVEADVAKLVATRDLLIRLPGRVVGFAGDLTPEEAKRAAEGLLPEADAAVPDGIEPRFLPLVPASSRRRNVDVEMRKLTQVYLEYDRDSLPWNDPRRPAFLIADHVLGGHFYSRLYVALRHDAGDTYGAGTSEAGDVVPNGAGVEGEPEPSPPHAASTNPTTTNDDRTNVRITRLHVHRTPTTTDDPEAMVPTAHCQLRSERVDSCDSGIDSDTPDSDGVVVADDDDVGMSGEQVRPRRDGGGTQNARASVAHLMVGRQGVGRVDSSRRPVLQTRVDPVVGREFGLH